MTNLFNFCVFHPILIRFGLGAIIGLTRPSGQRCVLQHFWTYPLTEMREMRGGNLSTAIATFSGRYARELLWCYSWLWMPSGSFLYIKISISCILYKSVTYGRTDGPTDGRTDTPSYRDARTHLKTKWNELEMNTVIFCSDRTDQPKLTNS